MNSASISSLAAAVTAIAAVGGSTIALAAGASEAIAPINACALLSQQQVSQITGLPVEAGVRTDEGKTSIGAYSSTCFWRSANPGGGRPNFAILNAMSWPADGPGAGKFLQSFRDAARDGTIGRTPVPLQLGDEALWWGDGVAVRTNNVSFGISVSIVNEPPDRRRPMEEALAKIVLQSLEPV